jgi:cell division protein FtsW
MANSKRVPRTQPEKSVSYYLLLASVIALSAVGLVMVFSASHATALANYNDSFYYLKSQLKWMIAGFAVMFALVKLDWRFIRRLSIPIWCATVAFLVLVMIPGFGVSSGGASRWVTLGPITFQPSELAKFALIILAADFLARKRDGMDDWREMAWPILPMAGVMAGLVMIQPDLGTTLIICSILLIMLWVGGIRVKHLIVMLSAFLPAVALLIYFESYRLTRFLAFLNPWNDPQGAGYQIIQSLYAFGSGGLFGVGLGASKAKFFYLPEAHTDFIFAVIGEEGGLLATISIIILFCLVAYACVRISIRATTYFDRLIATGISGMIIVQAVLNMGAVTGVLPITGVPLPFISAGGTSLLVTLTGVGILLSIATRERKANEGIIDARDYFRGGNRRPPVSRARAGRRDSQSG